MEQKKNPRRSFKWIYGLILIFSIVIIIISIFNYTAFRDHLIEKEQKQLLTIAETTADQIERFMDELLSDVYIIRKSILEEHELDKQSENAPFYSILDHYFQIQNGSIYGIYYMNESGELLYENVGSIKVEDYTSPVLPVALSVYENTPQITDYYQLRDGDLAVDIITRLSDGKGTVGYLRLVVKLNTIYNDLVRDITIGEKGYASIKDADGILLMHPKSEDIGTNVMVARKTEYPDYDWSELEAIVEKQKQKQSGTGIYHSIWYHDEKRDRVKKFNAYVPADVGSTFWVVNVSMDFEEIDALAKRYFYSNSLFAGFFPLVLTILLIYIITLKKNLVHLESEKKYNQKLSALNKELEQDISERKLLEKELIKSKHRFRKLYDAGHDLSFSLYLDPSKAYKISQVNRNVCEVMNKPFEAIMETDYLAYTSTLTKEALDELVERLQTDQHVIFESELTLGKQSVPVEISAQLFSLEDEPLLLLVARDISIKKAQEAELEKNQALLIYKFRMVAMGEMIANIAHQWRQPLGSLSLMVTNLKDAYEHDEMTKTYFDGAIDKIKFLVQKMSDVIDEFRYFFNPNQDKAWFDPKQQIQMALEMVKDRLDIDEVSVTLDCQTQAELYGYPNQFSQVVLNILNNSIDALHEQAKGRITIDLSDNEAELYIEIANNGPKLQPGDEDKVFDPYFTTKRDREGTGIGLYMTQMIIANNFGGDIRMENTHDGVKTIMALPKKGVDHE